MADELRPSQISSLSESAQEHVKKLYTILSAGGKLINADARMLGMSFLAMRDIDIAEVFRVNPRTVRRWASDLGCPRRPDGLYELLAVIEWYAKRNNPDENPQSLSQTKTQQEIAILRLKEEKLTMELETAKLRSVPTDVHERVKQSLIESFTTYLRNSMLRNVSIMRTFPDSELELAVTKFIIELTKQMVSAAARAERV
jgi:phage terminase Nu1 subunit (DNA packaging protein)